MRGAVLGMIGLAALSLTGCWRGHHGHGWAKAQGCENPSAQQDPAAEAQPAAGQTQVIVIMPGAEGQAPGGQQGP